MGLLESIGLAFVIFTSLFGIAALTFFGWHGVKRLRRHLDIGRLDEDAAIGDHLNLRAQRERLVAR